MGSIVTGNSTAVRLGWDQQFDPTTGWQTAETWQGTKAQIGAIAPLFRANGAKTKVSNSGALWTLEATWTVEYSSGMDSTVPAGTAPASAEVALEVWNMTVELVQVDLRAAPALLALFGGPTPLAQETLSGAIQLADDAIKASLNLADYLASKGMTGIPLTPPYYQVYRLRAAGVVAFEEKRPTLSRVKTYSPTYPEPLRVSGVEVVYTSQSLISTFEIPVLIQGRMPLNPLVTRVEAAWGWKQRRQDSAYSYGKNKIEESSDWVFAQWSTVLYSFI